MSRPDGGPPEVRKFVIPELVLGDTSCRLAGHHAFNLGIRRALLVTDGGVSAAGWSGLVGESLQTAGVAAEVFEGVSVNPRAEEVMAGVEAYVSARCDGVVAVGGGSAIDVGKGIGVVVNNGEDILDYEGVDRVGVPIPPLLCVPTTAGSAADVSQFALITDRRRRLQCAVVSKMLVPDVSILDPRTVTTVPKELTASTGMDALVHAVEAFVSNAGSPVTDLLAREAIELVVEGLPRCLEVPSDVAAREVMVRASLLAGMAFSNAILGAAHALTHALGGLLDLPHGRCGALLLGPVIRFNFDAATYRYRKIAQALGVEVEGKPDHVVRVDLVAGVDDLRRRVGLDGSLALMGVRRSDIPELARNAVQDPCLLTNPRPASRRDLEVILEEAI